MSNPSKVEIYSALYQLMNSDKLNESEANMLMEIGKCLDITDSFSFAEIDDPEDDDSPILDMSTDGDLRQIANYHIFRCKGLCQFSIRENDLNMIVYNDFSNKDTLVIFTNFENNPEFRFLQYDAKDKTYHFGQLIIDTSEEKMSDKGLQWLWLANYWSYKLKSFGRLKINRAKIISKSLKGPTKDLESNTGLVVIIH